MNESLFSNEYFNVWILLQHVSRLISRAREKELLKHDVTAEQADALFCMRVIGDKVTPTELSRCIIREPHTVAGLVNRMEKKGLLKKVKDLPRKNMVRLKPTDMGKQVYKITSRRESISKIMSCLSKRELHQLKKILEKLQNRGLDELGMKERPLGPPPLSKLLSEYESADNSQVV